MPRHPLTVGVTVMVAVIGEDVRLVAVNPGIFPVPLAPNPIEVLEFVQEKLPPVGTLTKFVVANKSLLQTTILLGTVTVGVGFTVIV